MHRYSTARSSSATIRLLGAALIDRWVDGALVIKTDLVCLLTGLCLLRDEIGLGEQGGGRPPCCFCGGCRWCCNAMFVFMTFMQKTVIISLRLPSQTFSSQYPSTARHSHPPSDPKNG